MKSGLLISFDVDKENNQIVVKRAFHAPVEKVWAAWTQSEILDQWWAPKPWKARTKSMDFREGGHWLYAMAGPEGEEHWARADYKSISPEQSFSAKDSFCDENGEVNSTMPGSDWFNTFEPDNDTTVVTVNINYERLEDLETTIQMGFKEGFSMAFENLDALLAQ